MKNLHKKPIVGITGSSGILGSYFIRKYKSKFIYKKYSGDITNFNKLNLWYKKANPEYFLHFAAKVPVNFVEKNYKLVKKINLGGTNNLIKIIKKDKKLKWFFFSSTSHVYQKSKNALKENSNLQPQNKYAKTKFLAERKLEKLDSNKICIGRIFSYTSTNQSNSFVIPSIFNQIKQKKNVFYDFNSKRDFVHIDDICSAIYILLKKKSSGIYNIGSGKSVKISNIVTFFSKLFNYKIKIITKKKKDIDNLKSNISKIKKLGWFPKKRLEDILTEYYYKNK